MRALPCEPTANSHFSVAASPVDRTLWALHMPSTRSCAHCKRSAQSVHMILYSCVCACARARIHASELQRIRSLRECRAIAAFCFRQSAPARTASALVRQCTWLLLKWRCAFSLGRLGPGLCRPDRPRLGALAVRTRFRSAGLFGPPPTASWRSARWPEPRSIF